VACCPGVEGRQIGKEEVCKEMAQSTSRKQKDREWTQRNDADIERAALPRASPW
jgi:hypothetical protein